MQVLKRGQVTDGAPRPDYLHRLGCFFLASLAPGVQPLHYISLVDGFRVIVQISDARLNFSALPFLRLRVGRNRFCREKSILSVGSGWITRRDAP